MTAREMTFIEMLRAIRLDREFTLADIAKPLGISPQYLHDLENGRRKPTVKLVNRICEYMGRKTQGRLAWHLAAARAHGWEIPASALRSPYPDGGR